MPIYKHYVTNYPSACTVKRRTGKPQGGTSCDHRCIGKRHYNTQDIRYYLALRAQTSLNPCVLCMFTFSSRSWVCLHLVLDLVIHHVQNHRRNFLGRPSFTSLDTFNLVYSFYTKSHPTKEDVSYYTSCGPNLFKIL